MIDADDVLQHVYKWQKAGKRVAIATAVSTWGSSPRPVGSQLVVDDEGSFIGSVSGGCVEGAVIHEALDAIATGRPRLLEFGVTSERAWEVGLACGGKIEVFVERLVMKEATLSDLLAARASDVPVALATRFATGEQGVILPDTTRGDLSLDAELIARAREAILMDRSATVETETGRVFIHVFNPPARLIIIGAVHIAEPLARIGAMAGFSVLVVDPRQAFASRGRFEGFAVTIEWPDAALTRLKLDTRTAVVTLTHDPKLDDAALAAALCSPAFYIGSLGSKKTHAARLHRLRQLGFSDADLARIHGPVGLAIGAQSSAEIAIAIMAEITQVRRQGNAQ